MKTVKEIVSGGQTGVDRATLDVAILNNIPYGGWCPKGRIDEEGMIPSKYEHLKEISGVFTSDNENYAERTIANIKDSDGTLILLPMIPLPDNIKDGTLLTIDEAKKNRKPYLLVNLRDNPEANNQQINGWIIKNSIHKINIAGPRESSAPGIYFLAYRLLQETLKATHQNKSRL